jgi:hypothetical protein
LKSSHSRTLRVSTRATPTSGAGGICCAPAAAWRLHPLNANNDSETATASVAARPARAIARLDSWIFIAAPRPVLKYDPRGMPAARGFDTQELGWIARSISP